jgi:small subunit ribosomal protein S6
MSLYESTFIIRHDMSAQQVEQLAESFSDIIKNNGGDVTKTEHWGLKTLAYRIKKHRKGHYVFFNVDAPSAAVQEYERNLRLSEDVLRYLTIRVDALDPEPTPMMQARASRDERSRRGGRPRDDAGSGDKESGDKKSGDKESSDKESGDKESDGSKAAKAKEEKTETAKPADDAPPKDADPAPKADGEADKSGDQT